MKSKFITIKDMIEAHTVGYEENIMDQKRKTQPNIEIQSQLHNK